MTDSLPPDPYRALGVPREATAAIIKTAYKKAALRCHPDKAKDKASAAHEFHKISQAYELLQDPEKRQTYEDQLRNAQLKKDAYDKRGPHSPYPRQDGRSPAFATRSPPSQSTPFAAQPNGRVYEERRPKDRSYFEEDARFDNGYFPEREDTRASSRKHEGYSARPPPRPAPPPRAQESRNTFRTERVTPKFKEKEDLKRRKEQETKRARTSKYAASVTSDQEGSSSSEDDHYAAQKKPEQERVRQHYPQKPGSRKGDDRQGDKYSQWEKDAREYRILREKEPEATGSSPPPPPVDQSYRNEAFRTYHEPEARRPGTRDSRPEMPRRGSSKPSNDNPPRPRSSGKDNSRRGSRTPEDVSETPQAPFSERRPTYSSNYHSSPMVGGKGQTRRAQTVEDYAKEVDPRIAGQKRATTLPVRPSTGERTSSNRTMPRRPERVDTTLPRGSSNLQREEPVDDKDSGYSTSTSSETPQPDPQFKKQTTHTYHQYGSGSAQNSPRQPDIEQGFGMDGFNGQTPDFGYSNGQSTSFRDFSFGNSTATNRHHSSSPPPQTPLNRPRASSSSSAAKYTPTSHHDRERGPPPSRSAYVNPISTDLPHHPGSAPPTRRPSYQANSSQHRVPADQTRTNSTPMPTLSTSGINPPHLKPSSTAPPYVAGEGRFFGEIHLSPSSSPVQGPGTSSRRVSEDARHTRPPREDHRYGSSAHAGARKSNENVDRASLRKSNENVDRASLRKSNENVDRASLRKSAESVDRVDAIPSRSRERERERGERVRERSGGNAKAKESSSARSGRANTTGGASGGRKNSWFGGGRKPETAYA